MGAVFCSETFPGELSESALRSQFRQLIERDAYENGHGGYSGSFAEARGLDIKATKVFKTTEDALSWIGDNHAKWSDPFAVRVEGERVWADEKGFSEFKKALDLELAASKSFQKKQALLDAAGNAFLEAVDKFLVDSSLARDKVKGMTRRLECDGCGCAIAPGKVVSGDHEETTRFFKRQLKEYDGEWTSPSKGVEAIERVARSLLPQCPVCKAMLIGKSGAEATNKRVAKVMEKLGIYSENLKALHTARGEIEEKLKANPAYTRTESLWVVGGIMSS